MNIKVSLFSAFVFVSLSGSAGAGPISSGGTPETEFQHDRAAIQTILNTDDVLALLEHKGKVTEISAFDRTRDVYRVVTEKCDLHVQFVRTCSVGGSGLPQCDYSSSVLLAESVGDCAI